MGAEQARLATVERQAARLAAGQRPRGGKPSTDVAAQTATLAQATRTAVGVHYLGQELRRLLEVVVLDRRGLLDAATRQQDLVALLDLLAEVRAATVPAQQADLKHLHTQLTHALSGLLAFTGPLDAVQQEMEGVLGGDGLALVAWTWQRRAILGPTTDDLVAGLAPAWQPAARVLMTAWESAVRASSAAENWHSLLRPHLAVHRTLSPGLLALLAVWHNHRVFTRGTHKGPCARDRVTNRKVMTARDGRWAPLGDVVSTGRGAFYCLRGKGGWPLTQTVPVPRSTPLGIAAPSPLGRS